MFVKDEIKAIMERDPAARNVFEALLYPSLHAIILHRLAHALYKANVPFFPRLISQIARFLTGIEIHPGAKIGKGLFIDHGMGVVIGETAELGDNVTLYQGVTLGGTGKEQGKRHPTLQNDVLVGVGAKVLGAITLGEGARIGGGAVVLKDVPPHSTAVGVPARVVATRGAPGQANQRVENMPDPEGEMIDALQEKSRELEERLQALLAEHVKETHEVEADHVTVEELEDRLSEMTRRLERIEKALLGLEIRPAINPNVKSKGNGNGNGHNHGHQEPQNKDEEAKARGA
ncbi:MAG TPA: serine O-acetyltransferase EpsC [Chloroflexia bacterium]|nr:serine O-acetyltransferase EpsC [Chloroflexia bacterium]